MQKYLLIGVGGALGAMLRYYLGDLAAQRFDLKFPVGTFVINVSACFLIGFIVAFLNQHAGLSPAWRYAIPVGFIGAYSTFSTFEWELWRDLSHGQVAWAIFYLVASLVLGFVAVMVGSAAGRALP